VYKKTLFEINNDYRKNMLAPTKENIQKLDLINKYIKILKIILLKITNTESKINTDYIDNFQLFCIKLNNIKIELDNLNILETLITVLDNKTNNIDNFFKIILFITKKINKKIDSIKKIKDKIHLEEFDLYIVDDIEKFTTWLVN
jgi:hypothetical protein